MQKRKAYISALLVAFVVIFIPNIALAESLTIDFGSGGPSNAGRVIQLVLLLTVLTLAPSILMMMTSFTRIVVVFSFLRSAMGIQSAPPNSVIISLALFLTMFIMAPVLEKSYKDGLEPYMAQEIAEQEAFDKTMAPLHGFMMKHVRDKDLRLFMRMAKIEDQDIAPEDTPFRVLIPAFVISELRRAFEIGFLIFLPFLIMDMVVASVLMSMGMMMLPPILISLPFKLVFFVLIDGWYLVTGSLVESFL